MKAASIQQIKQELHTLKAAQLASLCLRLGKFRKENKELLTYLLFEAGDEAAYLQSVKEEVSAQFDSINTSNVYFIKKSLRKIIRLINRYANFSDVTATELDLRVHFCQLFKAQGWPLGKSKVLDNIYEGQLKKINTLLNSLHEDLQYDYRQLVQTL